MILVKIKLHGCAWTDNHRLSLGAVLRVFDWVGDSEIISDSHRAITKFLQISVLVIIHR